MIISWKNLTNGGKNQKNKVIQENILTNWYFLQDFSDPSTNNGERGKTKVGGIYFEQN